MLKRKQKLNKTVHFIVLLNCTCYKLSSYKKKLLYYMLTEIYLMIWTCVQLPSYVTFNFPSCSNNIAMLVQFRDILFNSYYQYNINFLSSKGM